MLKNREIALQGGFKYNTVLTGKKGTKLNNPDEDEAFEYYLSTLPEN
jgi:hypothetical protein